jgi:2-polyprenyl-6-methoxyphenol hydroxylase-like FAD-dependent oxidoreductase
MTRELLHECFADWHADFHELLAGDAAHLMSPFAGEGANLAMIDGADLARAILAHRNDTEAAFAAYETIMFPRATEKAAESTAGLELTFEASSPQRLLNFFAGYGAPPNH